MLGEHIPKALWSIAKCTPVKMRQHFKLISRQLN